MTTAIRIQRNELRLPFSPKDEKTCQTLERAVNLLWIISCLPREMPSKSQHNEKVLHAHKFLKTIPPSLQKHPCIKACAREILAFKLGIPSLVFEHAINQGFEAFASKPPLAPYLAEYNHEIKIDPQGRILLKKDGRYTHWHMLKSLVQIPQRDPATNQPWLYGPQGIQNKNMFEWSTLAPYKFEDPKNWGGQYIFEFCCCCEDMPRFIGDHSWLRLKTPTGAIYSVGLYRPYKRNSKQNYHAPLRVQKGNLMQPDVSEFWNTPIHRIPFVISEETFLKMKQTIEEDQQKDLQTFQLIGQNCTQYVEKIGKIGNIQLPIGKPFWELLNQRFGHPCIQKGVDTTASILPEKVNQVFAHLFACMCNTALLCGGAGRIDPLVAQKKIPARPHLSTFQDLCDPEKLIIKHPFTVGHNTKEYVRTMKPTRPHTYAMV